MKVSVAIPTYNGAQFISATISSVLSQTFTDFELVVSDDASSDETIGLIGALVDPRITVIGDRSHVGPAGNWNRALAHARGEYVKILAQDDILYPENLKVAVAALDRDPELSLVAVRRNIIGADGRILMADRGLSGLCGRIDPADGARRIVRSGANRLGEGAAILFRREAAECAGIFDDSLPYTIDVDYWLRLLRWGPAYGVCETHAAFRISADSWSSTLAREQGRQFRSLIDRVAADPGRDISKVDVAIGKAQASLNARLRRLFYLRHRARL